MSGDINVFPNPASEYLNVEMANDFKPVELLIYHINGQLAKQFDLTENSIFRIGLASLKPGLYLIKVKDEDGNFYSKRILKQ